MMGEYMRTLTATTLALALVALPAFASAQEDSPRTTVQAGGQASVELADRLADIAANEDQLATQLPANFSAAFIQSLKAEGSYNLIEQASPGIVQAMIDAVMPLYIGSARARLPALQSEIRDIYLSHMNFEEMRELHDFYTSPIGVKFTEVIMAANRDGSITAAAVGDPSESTQATADRVMTGLNGVLASNAGKFSQSEMQALIAAMRKPALVKMNEIGGLIVHATIEWDSAIPLSVKSAMESRIEQIAAERLGS